MGSFAVYADWLAPEPISDEVVVEISRHFRPDDETVCVWVEADAPNALRLSLDVEAPDYADAIPVAERFAREAAALGRLAGRPLKIVVCDEIGQVQWEPEG